MRVDGVLLVSVAALSGAWLATSPWIAGGTLLCCGVLLARRAPPLLLALALVVAVLGAVRARAAIAELEQGRALVREALGSPRRCAVTLRLDESPVWLGGTARLLGRVEAADCDERVLPLGVRVQLYGGPSDLRRGDVVEGIADLAPVRLFRNLGAPDPTLHAARRQVWLSGGMQTLELVERGSGLGAWIDRARAHVRRRIVATFSPKAEELARALVLGETDLSDEDNDAFKKSGLSHLLAVSGTHLVFAVIAVVRGLRAILTRVERLARAYDVGRIAAAIGVGLSLLYADFAGGSGSAWRAAWMLSAVFAARALGRKPNGVRALAASLVVGVAVDPLAAYDLSFLLSVAATVGLMAVGAPIVRRFRQVRSAVLRWGIESVVATVASMIPCAPLLLLMAPELTLAGIIANVIAAPFGELVSLPLCLSHGLLAWFPALERGVALTASGALLAVRAVAHASADSTWLAVELPQPTGVQLAVLGLTGVLWLARRRRWVLPLAAISLCCLEAFARTRDPPKGELRVTFVDVGQGDGTLVDFPSGTRWLVDAGGFMGVPLDPGERAVLPLLRARRAAYIDVMIISHPHPDHFTGLLSVMKQVPVRELWDTGQGEAHGAGPVYRELLDLARARGVRVRRPAELCGEHRVDGVRVAVLGPCPGLHPDRSANDNSFVIRLGFGEHAVLLTGDAEHDQEEELIRRYGDGLRADILKVGHHGSRTSTTPAFLAKVNPQVAVISCGIRNRFGHPHEPTLETLHDRGVGTLRTDEDGSVVVTTDGRKLSVQSYRSARGFLFD